MGPRQYRARKGRVETGLTTGLHRLATPATKVSGLGAKLGEQERITLVRLIRKGIYLMAELQDFGPNPFVVDIEKVTEENETFRTALWTGEKIQLTLMSIPVGGDVGLEVHKKEDQFLRIEKGRGLVQMGPTADEVTFEREVGHDWAVLVPVGVWHNIKNIGDEPMQIYSIYGPPHHDHGTVHQTQEDDHDHDHDH